MSNESDDKSPHILNTSSNLLGLCFIVLTSLHALNLKEATVIDEFTAVACIFFMTSSILSFLSMRKWTKQSERYEKIADVVFLGGLVCLFVTTMLLVLGIIV